MYVTATCGAEDGTGTGVERALPLNLKRLTVTLLQQMSKRLGVPTFASIVDIQTIKIQGDGENPKNTQVTLQEGERILIIISLQDRGLSILNHWL